MLQLLLGGSEPKGLKINLNRVKSIIRSYPVISSLIMIIFMSVLTEIKLENLFSDSIGYQAAFYIRIALTQGLVAFTAAFILAKLGLLRHAGLTKPEPKKALWHVWPIIVLGVLNGFSLFDGTIKIDFSRPALDLLFLLAPLSTGFVEELVCRGFVLTVMLDKYGSTKKGCYKAVLLSSLLFGLVHMLNFVTGRGTLIQVGSQAVYAIFFGVYFAAIFIRCNSLWPVIITHALFDFFGSVQEIAVGAKFDNTMSGNVTWQSALISIALMAPLFIYGLIILRKAPLDKNSAGALPVL
jgi:CAAX amino terminal protease family.